MIYLFKLMRILPASNSDMFVFLEILYGRIGFQRKIILRSNFNRPRFKLTAVQNNTNITEFLGKVVLSIVALPLLFLNCFSEGRCCLKWFFPCCFEIVFRRVRCRL